MPRARRARSDRSMPGGRPSGSVFASIATTWLVLAVVWLALVSTFAVDQLLAGIIAVSIATTAVEVVRRRAGERGERLAMPVRAAWLRYAGRALARAPRDLVTVLAAAGRAAIRRRPIEGTFRTVGVSLGGDGPEDRMRRAVAVTVASLAPNGYVVRVEREGERLLVHELEPAGRRSPLATLVPED